MRISIRRVGVNALITAALVACLFSDPAAAQSTRGSGGTPPDIGRPSREDPTDEKHQQAGNEALAQKLLEAGQKLLAKGDIVHAKAKFKGALELTGGEGSGGAALSALFQIHDQGTRELQDAQQHFDKGEYLKALKGARRVKIVFSNLFGTSGAGNDRPNLSRLAAKLVEKIEKDPAAKGALQEEKAEPLGKRISRLERESKRNPARLLDLFNACSRVAEKYPASTTGMACADRIKSLRKDKKAWRLIGMERERRDLEAALARVTELERDGKTAEAQREIEKLSILHPGKTRAELEKLAKRPIE